MLTTFDIYLKQVCDLLDTQYYTDHEASILDTDGRIYLLIEALYKNNVDKYATVLILEKYIQ